MPSVSDFVVDSAEDLGGLFPGPDLEADDFPAEALDALAGLGHLASEAFEDLGVHGLTPWHFVVDGLASENFISLAGLTALLVEASKADSVAFTILDSDHLHSITSAPIASIRGLDRSVDPTLAEVGS